MNNINNYLFLETSLVFLNNKKREHLVDRAEKRLGKFSGYSYEIIKSLNEYINNTNTEVMLIEPLGDNYYQLTFRNDKWYFIITFSKSKKIKIHCYNLITFKVMIANIHFELFNQIFLNFIQNKIL